MESQTLGACRTRIQSFQGKLSLTPYFSGRNGFIDSILRHISLRAAKNGAQMQNDDCFFPEYPQNVSDFFLINLFGEFETIHGRGV
jgi:hypothetical protein